VVLHAAGLPGDFVARWAANHALFPRGVDLVLCAGERLAALPRSVAIEEV
jgi:alpha-D-ribose 1-methylphosphonate 5-triphosphate synthase subunit PhnH